MVSMWIIQPPVLDVHDDGDDVHDGVHVDLYIMVKCVCVCHEKVTKFFFSLPNYF